MTRILAVFTSVIFAFGLLGAGCIISSGSDECDNVSCDGHGLCFVYDGQPECDCDPGYINDGPLHCVLEDMGSAIDMDWAFGPGARSCADAHVDQVRVQMFDGADELLNSVVDCTVGGAIIEPVDDGTYTIDLTGLSENGDEWYFATDDVTISGQNVDLGTVVLSPTGTGDMSFTWAFGQAELDCLTAGVGRVRVEVYDGGGNLEFEVVPYPYCDELGATITNFALGSWNLVLVGLCESDLSEAYELDANLIVAHPGVNDYGTVILEDLGGCQ